MKKLLACLFIAFSFALHSQFEDLASVDVDIQEKEQNLYKLSFVLKLKKGASTYVHSDDIGAPPSFALNLHQSEEYEPVGEWVFPPHKTKYEELFEANVNYVEGKDFVVTHLLRGKTNDFTVSGDYFGQVCEEGRCIPTVFPVNFEIDVGKGSVAPYKKSNTETNTDLDEPLPLSGDYIFSKEKKEIKSFNNLSINEGEDKGLFAFFLIAFISGLAALLTPCVFPMIPMTVTFFLKKSESGSKGKLLALIFGLSIIFIYVGLGIIINLFFDEDTANYIATHWIPNIIFFLVFVFFAASFFGMFEITLPSRWSNLSDKKADRGGLAGAFFMALTLSIVSFSCTGPIVGNVIIESVTVGGVRPFVGMLGFSLAFALPFTFFAFFPSLLNKLPKSGGWLNAVKVVLGFLELALALKFLSVADQTAHWHILDREIYLALWITIFSLMGLYLIGKIKFSHDSELPHLKVPRLFFAIVTFSFVVYLLPGMWGAPLKGLSGYLPPSSSLDFNITQMLLGEGGITCSEPKYSDKLHLPHGIKGYFEYEQGMSCAKEQNKPVFIDFTGHGCVNCRRVEDGVWSHPQILKLLKEEFVVISLYIDEHTINLEKDQQYISVFDGKKKIKTLGQKNADIQKSWFNKLSQPYYVTLDNDKELLAIPIAYDKASEVNEFKKFLVNSLKEYKKRNP
ncbi:MAG: disulfide bond formation protein DsbD [Flavobacteriales bacterium]|nr:disulfide bond formation protein DsbD [Flavobacteriales bacterium]|tara:strand:+ start:29259 stop:31298 length:2040 start_codon:yes stop_codon:yes gene_type:complete